MAKSPHRSNFPSTHWSLVQRARGEDALSRREALGSLVKLYWPALRAHLVVRRRLAPEAAEELLQGFAADRILEQQFLGHADPSKGRFRSFLLRCLENYRIDHWRGQKLTERLDDQQQADLPGSADAPDVFDIAWARQVLKESLRRTWIECRDAAELPVWSLFVQRVLRPTLFDSAAPSYDRLVAELGFESPQHAANLLVTAKRRFRRALEAVVGQYVQHTADVQREIIELRVILSIVEPGSIPLSDFSLTGSSFVVREETAERPPLAAGPLAELLPSPLAGEGPGVRGRTTHDSASSVDPDLPTFLDESDAASLARLFGVDDDRDAVWEPFDLESMLRRLLSIPLAEALPGLDHRAIAGAARSIRGATPGSLTLNDVFGHRKPSVTLLREIKEWARRATREQDPLLPTELASLLYFASIIAAHLRRGQWISKLDPDLIRRGAEMLSAQPWIGEPFRATFQEFSAEPVG